MEHIEATEESQRTFPPWWQTIAIVAATWLVSTAVNWGVIQAHQQDMDRRQDATDRALSRTVQRDEYDSWRQDMTRRLDRIEEKLDEALLKR